jgi:hypothetical protein
MAALYLNKVSLLEGCLEAYDFVVKVDDTHAD